MKGIYLGENTLCPYAVVAQLRDELRAGIEPFFFADFLDKFDDDLLIVQTAVEIKYVRFQMNAVVFFKRRAPADIGHAAEGFFTDADPYRVHAQRRDHAVSDGHISRRESKLLPPSVTAHDRSHDGNVAPKKFGGPG